MGLVKILILLITIHGALGYMQMSAQYNLGDRPVYGNSGFLSHTPARHLLRNDYQEEDRPGFDDPIAIIRRLNDLGDTINGLVFFDYPMFDYIDSADGISYNFVVGVRLLGYLVWLWFIWTLVRVIFRSNLLSSPTGLALVLGGGGVFSLLSGLGFSL